MEILDDLFNCLFMEEIEELVVLMACKIWKRRNDFVFGEYFPHPNTLVSNSKKILEHYKGLNHKLLNPAAKTTLSNLK